MPVPGLDPGMSPGIHVILTVDGVDGRIKSGHDGGEQK